MNSSDKIYYTGCLICTSGVVINNTFIVRFDCYFLFSVKDPCVLWNNYTALPTETSLRVIQSWFVIAPWAIITTNKRWSLAWTSLYKYERYRYRVKDYLNVWTENGSGYCMHSDCVIGYFANNHYCSYVSKHVGDPICADVPHLWNPCDRSLLTDIVIFVLHRAPSHGVGRTSDGGRCLFLWKGEERCRLADKGG